MLLEIFVNVAFTVVKMSFVILLSNLIPQYDYLMFSPFSFDFSATSTF